LDDRTVIKKMSFQWRLRQVMAEHGMFQTTDLVPLLAERGVILSREQVFRLVTKQPQRLSMDVFAALCDIFDCTPNDLVTPEVVNLRVEKKTAGGGGAPGTRPRTVIRRPGTGQ
jgi:DNA-binding Xre family transcriptional regulator